MLDPTYEYVSPLAFSMGQIVREQQLKGEVLHFSFHSRSCFGAAPLRLLDLINLGLLQRG